MFIVQDLAVIGYGNGFTLWHYRTQDADVMAPGYFDPSQGLFRAGDDIIVTEFGDSGAQRHRLYVSAASDTSVVVAKG